VLAVRGSMIAACLTALPAGRRWGGKTGAWTPADGGTAGVAVVLRPRQALGLSCKPKIFPLCAAAGVQGDTTT